MASNYTEHYGLCQWEATDQVLREEFNEDNRKVDEALSNMASALSKIVTGSYVGNGAGTRTISLGFTPKAVYVCHESGQTFNCNGNYCYGGLALNGKPVKSEPGASVVKIVSSGFEVHYDIANTKGRLMSNAEGYTFYYAALE